ncbi:MAG: glycosyltransferase family 4 protein [Anaerolineae bacterium]|nr:glycosyltransferase family 4 protein [Anaerolineae bacterium]
MRVLMISKACIVGIYQRKLTAMVEVAPDLDLTVVVPPFWRDERGVTRLERVYTDGYRLEIQPLWFNGSFHMHFYPRLHSVIKHVKPDLVHIDEEPYNLATYHANVLARRAGAKTLWFSWQNLARQYPPPFSWIERYNLAHSDHALVGSQTAAKVWRAKGYAGGLGVIPQFGVDAQLFCPHADRTTEAPVHIVYVGRLVPEKGCDLLLRALTRVEGAWRATVLGSGPEAPALEASAVALGLEDRIVFRPWLPSAEMPGFYRTADVLVLPSRSQPNWTEQFGRVLIEAMASEVAVVGASAGEIPYVVGDAGWVFPEGDVDALADALTKLVVAPGLRSELGAQGRARVLAAFTQERIAAATVAVYRELTA